ncbi:hypothetical protein GCM10027162_16100 [Streptomyces incanus]
MEPPHAPPWNRHTHRGTGWNRHTSTARPLWDRRGIRSPPGWPASRKTELESSQADHKLSYSERELRAVVGPRSKGDPGTGSGDPIEPPERRMDDDPQADPTEDRPRT